MNLKLYNVKVVLRLRAGLLQKGTPTATEMLAQRANGTPIARKINNCRREEPSAATRVPALTCKDMPGAGDENRTRTISLGSLWRCSVATCGLADLTLWGPGVRPDPLPCSAR